MDNYYVHPLADVQSESIGDSTRIWQYTVVLKNAIIGSTCNICSHCFIENDVVIGNNVTLKFFVELCDGVTIEDDVFIAPHVSFTNDMKPRSKKTLVQPLKTCIKKGASIGANVALSPGITIGQYAFIAPGAAVSKNVPPFTFWGGVPAIHMGYVTKECDVLNMDLNCKRTQKQYRWENGEITEA